MSRGRPTKWNYTHIAEAARLAGLGCDIGTIAKTLGVDRKTFTAWMATYPELGAAIIAAKTKTTPRPQE